MTGRRKGGVVRNFSRFFLVVLTLLLGLAAFVFTLENQQGITLMFLGWVLPVFPASVLLLLAFLLGGLGGMFFLGGLRLLRKKS